MCIRIDKTAPSATAAVNYSLKHPAPIKSMNSNLVYFCLFHKNDYVELLRILMITVKLYSRTDTIDFLVLTESKFESAIKDLSIILNIPIRIKICNGLNTVLASCYIRYSIFDYEHINNYQKILYLDTDIIVQNDLTTLFNIDIDDRIYGVPEYADKYKYFTIESEWFGGSFFDFTTVDKNIKGINGGILFFKNTESSRLIFKDIVEHIKFMQKFGCRMPAAWDQPFLNYHCVRYNKNDPILLNKYAFIYFRNCPPLPSSPTDIILCHYAGGTDTKKNNILKHVLHILTNYKNLLKDPKSFLVPNIIGNTYSWNNGTITFTDNATFTTSWGICNYIWVDEFTLEANLSNHSYIFRFNSDYTAHINVRKDTLDYGDGSLAASTINVNFLNDLLNKKFTMVTMKRLVNLYNKCSLFTNTSYSFVECGVARGGCLAVMKKLAGPNNKVFGFDSFEGMPAITKDDISDYNKGDPSKWVGNNLSGGIENVYKTFQSLKLDMTNVHLIKGLFQDTLAQKEIIDKIGPIAVLRLDGDWYESIKVCLEALYDKVVVGGVIILDDYGHWVGNKKATDEFRQKRNILSPLIQTDYSEYYWIKQDTPSDLCELAEKYYVDKCPAFKGHTYTPEYHKLLSPIRNEIQLVCEIGIGNAPLMAPLTSINYKPGGSLRMWRDYFPQAQIVGCDILESVLFKEERITTFQTDQSNVESLNRLIESVRKLQPYADIILDDGSHIEEHMVTSFKTLWSLVKPNGFYIIEDIYISFLDRIAGLNKEFDFKDAKCVHIYKGDVSKSPMDNFVIFSKIIDFETRNDMLIAKAMDGCVGFCIKIDKTASTADLPAAINQSLKHPTPINYTTHMNAKMDKKTVCLNMIVKNEAHIIADTLANLLSYINFDYWVISDTGSTDATREIIKNFFAVRGISGELVEHEWRDFGYNRTKAFECAYNKTDYVFVWDADDEIQGEFRLPELLDADSYKFTFSNVKTMVYSRPQLFNNRKRWCYKGVLHEYANCLEPCGPSQYIIGPYNFFSGRKGDRSKDPNKYLKDALILEKAAEEALATGDPLYNRYTFYCAQSYNSYGNHEKAIEYYKKALTLDVWIQEKYVACCEIYNNYEKLKHAFEGLSYLVESYKYDKTRIEGVYRLIQYYCIQGSSDIAYMYYTLIQDFFENQYDPKKLGDKLFTKKAEYEFYLPYYMIIVGERTKRHSVCIKMYEIIFKYKFIAPQWWMNNLIHNLQFCIPYLPKDPVFLTKLIDYIDTALGAGISFSSNHYEILTNISNHYSYQFIAPCKIVPKT